MTPRSATAPSDRSLLSLPAAGALVVACAAAAGAATLLQVPPVVAVVGAAAPAIVLLLLTRPRAAALVTAFTFLLPDGLVPPALGSLLELALLALAGLAWLVHSLHRGEPVVLGAPLLLLVLFLTWAVASVTWAARPELAVSQLVALVMMLTLTFLLLAAAADAAGVRALMVMLAALGCVLVLAGLLSVATEGLAGGRLQVQATNANQYGNVLLLSCVGVLWLAVDREGTGRLPVLAPAFLCAVAVLVGLTASRGSLLAFVVLLGGLWLARRTRRTAKVTTALFLCLLAAAGPVVFASTADRVRAPDPEQVSRTTLWAAGLDLVGDRPLHGVGIGNGPHAMPPYVNARTQSDFFPAARDRFPAHNPLVEVAVDTGLPGLVLYVGALGSAVALFVTGVLRTRRRTGLPVDPHAAVVAATTAAFLIVWGKSGGLVAHPTTYVLLVLWTVGATTAARRPGPPAVDIHRAATLSPAR